MSLLSPRARKTAVRTALYAALSAYAVISLYPLAFTLFSSFKTNDDIFFRPFSPPTSYSLDNYLRAWQTSKIGRYFVNSALLGALSCALLAVIGSMASYVLAKFRFKLSGPLYAYFIAGLMIPAQSTIIPLTFNVGRLGLYDNLYVVMLILSAFQVPITILILTGFFKGIPDELEEAGIMDGANVAYIFIRIILPLAVPALVTVTILNFLVAWNNVLFPLVFISKDTIKPVAIGLLSFFGEKQADYSGVMAAIVITSMPPFLVYILLQEKVQKGMTAGAVKG